MNTCSSSAVANKWKMPQPMRNDWPISAMGREGWPVAAARAIHWPTQNTVVSNRPAVMLLAAPGLATRR